MVFHPKGENISSFFTSETMKRLPFRIYCEGRVLFSMEGAKTNKVSPRFLELHKLTHQLHDIGSSSYFFLGRLLENHNFLDRP